MSTRLKGWPRTLWQGYLDVAQRLASRRRSADVAHQDSATWVRGWMVLLLLLGGVATYAIAEEITLTTYYPSPRGVYNELRTAGNVQIGLLDPPPIGLPGPPRLHLVQGAGASGAVVPATLRVDDEAPVGAILDATPFLIDAAGKVGIGVSNPQAKLHIGGTAGTDGIMFPDGTVQKKLRESRLLLFIRLRLLLPTLTWGHMTCACS